jgi:hypothetical protein
MSFAAKHAPRTGRVRRQQFRSSVTELLEPRRLLSGYVASTVFSFDGSAGAEEPFNGLTQVNGLLYGETSGTLYALNPATNTVTNLANNIGSSFSAPGYLNGNLYIPNYHGIQEYNISAKKLTTISATLQSAGTNLVDVGGNLYGESYGPAGGKPFLYEINTTTNQAATLYTLTQGSMDFNVRNMADIGGNLYGAYEHTLFEYNLTTNTYKTVYTFDNGAGGPLGLIQIGGNCYGTTDAGSLFQFNPTSHTVTTLATFSGVASNDVISVNGNLYGTATGDEWGDGSVYEYNLSTKTASTIANFNGTNGSYPVSLIYADGHFYGTNSAGGAYGYANFGVGNGTIFELVPGDTIAMSPQLDNVTLRVDPANKSDIEVLNGNTRYEDLPDQRLAQIDVLGESYLFGGQSSLTIDFNAAGFFDVPVTFMGGIGLPQMNVTNTLSILDSATSGNRQWSVASNSISALDTGLSANPTIFYNAVQNVSLTGRASGDETISALEAPVIGITLPTSTTLNIHYNDAVNIRTTTSPITVDGTGSASSLLEGVTIGSDAPSLGGTLTGILAPVTVNNVSQVIADDSGDTANRTNSTLSASAIGGFGMPTAAAINYAKVGTLEIYGGTGSNTETINGNSATTTIYPGTTKSVTIDIDANGSPLTIDGKSHVDFIHAGANASKITAPITITNTAATSTLTLDDSSDTANRTGTLSSTAITGFGMGSGAAINYTGNQLAAVNVIGGSGTNTDTVTGTSAHTNLYPGTNHPATVNVRATGAPLVINGSTKVDYITIGSLAPSLGGTLTAITAPITVINTSDSSTLTLDDSGDTTHRTGTLTPTTITGLGMASSAKVTYTGSGLHLLTLRGNKGGAKLTETGTSCPVTLVNITKV